MVEELVNEVWNILLFSILLFLPLQVSKTRSHLLQEGKSFSYMEPKWFLKKLFCYFCFTKYAKIFPELQQYLSVKEEQHLTWPDTELQELAKMQW